MFFSVDGNYTEWSEFQACSVTCGKGIQARSRSCTNPPPQHGGKNCSAYGHPVETKECNLRECPSMDISKFLLSVNMTCIKHPLPQKNIVDFFKFRSLLPLPLIFTL